MSIIDISSWLHGLGTQWLPVLVDSSVKGLILLAAATVAVLIMRKKAAAARQAVWCGAMAGLLALPILALALPGWRVLPQWARVELPAPATPTEPTRPLEQPQGNTGPTEPITATQTPTPPAGGDTSVTGLPPAGTAHAPVNPPSTVPPVAPPPVALTTPPTAPAAPARWQDAIVPWLMAAWMAGTMACLIPLVLGRLSLWRLRRKSKPLTDESWLTLLEQAKKALSLRRPVTLLESPDRTMPMIWGLLRTKLLVPTEASRWSRQRRWVVALHELAHARRWDCTIKLMAHLACAVYWFNPLAWVAFKRLQSEAETACDDLVLSCTTGVAPVVHEPTAETAVVPMIRPSDYAQHLLEIASGFNSGMLAAYSSIAMARKSRLEGRLLAILDPRRNRRALTRWTVLAALVVVAAITIPIACLKPSQPVGFLSAKITLEMDQQGKHVPADKTWTTEIRDPAELKKLASFFPDVGRGKRSWTASGWKEGMRIEFRRADGGLTRVIVSMNDNLQTWTESGGRGDWPVQGDLKKYVFAIQKAVPAPPPRRRLPLALSLSPQARISRLAMQQPGAVCCWEPTRLTQ